MCLLATACSSDGPQAGGETGEGGAGAETQPGGGTGAPSTEEPPGPVGPTLRLGAGPGVRTLDPAAATDPAEGSLLGALLDPLVRIGPDGELVPELAESWTVSPDGRVVTFKLRSTGIWTNGDPVTAADFEYAWKRAAAPRFARANARLFADIAGAVAYTRCVPEEQDCEALREQIAIEALDDVTLQVTLKEPMPWFPQRVAHWAFLPVHEPTISAFRRRWTLPENIVSNGPFQLVDWQRRSSVTLERWDGWREADSVSLAIVEASLAGDSTARFVELEDGQLDGCLPEQCLPPSTLPQEEIASSVAVTAAPVTVYLSVNSRRVGARAQRRAIAIGLDRRALVANAAPPGSAPATALTPAGLPGLATASAGYLEERPKRPRARRLLNRAEGVRRQLVLAHPPGLQDLAELVALQLGKIGLEVTVEERAPDALANADLAIQSASAAPDLEALDVLDRWTCDGAERASGFCDPAYDRLAREARATVDDAERHALEAELEAALTGRQGAFPAVPLYWAGYRTVSGPGVEGLEANPLGVAELAAVSAPEP